MSTTTWLVDSSIYVFKAWYTWPDTLCDCDGEPVNATLGFLAFVRQLLEEQQPQSLAFAFDQSSKECWRRKIYPLYKANRDPAPENLKYQFRLCREFLRALGVAEYASDAYEADDLIGALALRAQRQQQPVVLVTGDKDLLQLLQPGDVWWELVHDKRITHDGVSAVMGVRADQIADWLALAGDKVDNIPGVPGIGVATAAKLLKHFDSIDELIEQSATIGQLKIRGAKRLQQLIEEHQQDLLVFREITRIRCDIESELQRDDMPSPDLSYLCELLGMNDEQTAYWHSVVG